jgi:REP-associated tyrosine transposase
MNQHRKRVKHFHEPGDVHELTFSCYQQRSLLDFHERRVALCESIGNAMTGQQFRLVAFVLMPEHVHLLVYPATSDGEVSKLLAAIKRPFSFRVKKTLQLKNPALLDELTIRERPSKSVFRFWQEGGGYDRNLSSEKTVRAAIDYIHENPVRRGLVSNAREWKWSSARWYAFDGQLLDNDLPTIHGLPGEFFVDTSTD